MVKEHTGPQALNETQVLLGCLPTQPPGTPALVVGDASGKVAITLRMKGLATCHVPAGSRVEKWGHGVDGKLSLDVPQQAVLAELLVRGAQSPGELRARTNRMSPMPTQDALIATLSALSAAGLVQRIGPAPGSRAERWCQLLTESLEIDVAPTAAPPSAAPQPPRPPLASVASPVPSSREASDDDRVASLETRVAALESRLQELSQALGG